MVQPHELLAGLTVSYRSRPLASGTNGTPMARRPCRLGPEHTDLGVVANEAVLVGDLGCPGGCLVALAIHHREVDEGAGRIPDEGSVGPRTVLPRVGVDVWVPVEQRADVGSICGLGGCLLRRGRAQRRWYSLPAAVWLAGRSPSQTARSYDTGTILVHQTPGAIEFVGRRPGQSIGVDACVAARRVSSVRFFRPGTSQVGTGCASVPCCCRSLLPAVRSCCQLCSRASPATGEPDRAADL